MMFSLLLTNRLVLVNDIITVNFASSLQKSSHFGMMVSFKPANRLVLVNDIIGAK